MDRGLDICVISPQINMQQPGQIQCAATTLKCYFENQWIMEPQIVTLLACWQHAWIIRELKSSLASSVILFKILSNYIQAYIIIDEREIKKCIGSSNIFIRLIYPIKRIYAGPPLQYIMNLKYCIRFHSPLSECCNVAKSHYKEAFKLFYYYSAMNGMLIFQSNFSMQVHKNNTYNASTRIICMHSIISHEYIL